MNGLVVRALKVGDEVATACYGNTTVYSGPFKVTRVLKSKVVLDNGDEYDFLGRRVATRNASGEKLPKNVLWSRAWLVSVADMVEAKEKDRLNGQIHLAVKKLITALEGTKTGAGIYLISSEKKAELVKLVESIPTNKTDG